MCWHLFSARLLVIIMLIYESLEVNSYSVANAMIWKNYFRKNQIISTISKNYIRAYWVCDCVWVNAGIGNSSVPTCTKPLLWPTEWFRGFMYCSVTSVMCQVIEAEWCTHAFVKCAITASDNGLWLVRRQSIVWTNAGFRNDCTTGNKFQLDFNQNTVIFTQENKFSKCCLRNGRHFVPALIC